VSKTVSEILSAAADLIEPEGAWTKGQFARDKEGFYSAASGRKAVCWCALGAIKRTAPDTEAAMAARDKTPEELARLYAEWEQQA
jgi:hypothetical protein